MLFSSFGLKRFIAAALTALAGVLGSNPATLFLLPVVSHLAALFGLTGLVHAGKEGNLLEDKKLSFSALFALLVSASEFVPQLQAYHNILLLIAAVFGLSTVTTTPIPKQLLKLASKKKK